MEQTVRVLLISDFNLDTFAAYLTHDPEHPRLEARAAPYGQVQQLLLNSAHECFQPRPDAVVVWTSPQAVCPALGEVLAGRPVALAQLIAEVDLYGQALEQVRSRTQHVFVPLWTLAPEHTAGGLLELQRGTGVTRALGAMNDRLLSHLDGWDGAFALNTEAWIREAGPNAFNPKLRYMAKVPYSNGVFTAAVAEIKSALTGLSGRARKLIAVDLDNTLWGGIAAETGWQRLTLGGHDAAGEAYADFQRGLLALKERGILLAIVSKNEESVALEAIRSHPEMVLSLNDFCGYKINWCDKAQNLAELTSELRLGLDAVVFLDDNPVERARVREALPEVLVPDWPEDPMLYRRALASLRCFNVPRISREDLERTRMYQDERARSESLAAVGSLDEWLKTLDTRVQVEMLGDLNLARAAQLLNKTNQFNLSTRRLSERELADWAGAPGHYFWTFRVSDKLGDSGLTGLASLAVEEDRGRLVDLVLSCRVMGRKIEHTMLQVVLEQAAQLGLKGVRARYLPTERNKPTLHFLESTGVPEPGDAAVFSWESRPPGTPPECITLEMVGSA